MRRRLPPWPGHSSGLSFATATACLGRAPTPRTRFRTRWSGPGAGSAHTTGRGPLPQGSHGPPANTRPHTPRARRARGDPAGYGPPARPGAPLAPPEPELAWVEPVSDSNLTGPVSPQDEVIRREEISLAFVAALQRLAPRQRAALLLHDVLGFSHAEVSEALAVSTSAVNTLLSRARQRGRTAAAPQPPISDPLVQQFLDRDVRAWPAA